MSDKPTPTDTLIAGVIGLLALTAALLMAWFVTERIPHLEDEATYLYQARTFAGGALYGPVPEYKSAFFVPFVIEVEGKMLGKYPIGWPLVLAAGEALGAGWVINPVLGGLTAALIYGIGRRLFDRETGMVAGVLAFTSPFFLIQSSTYMSHAAALFWGTLFLWAFLHLEDGPALGWSLVGGFAAGMMALTRQLPTGALAVCVGVVLILRLAGGKLTLGGILRRYAPLIVVSLALAALQPLYLWVTTGSPTTNLYTMIWPYDRLGFGPGIGPYEGHTLRQGLITTRQDLTLWSFELFGWPGISWLPLIPGLLAAWHKRERRDWIVVLLGPFLILVTVHVAYWVGAKVYGPRYYYEAHTGLVILAAAGLVGTVRWVGARLTRGQASPAWPALVILAGLVVLNVSTYLPERLQDWHGLYGITRTPLEELDRLRETDNVLVMVRGRFWVDYASLFSVNTPWHDGEIVAAHDRSARETLLLLREYPEREVWYYNDGMFTREATPYEEE